MHSGAKKQCSILIFNDNNNSQGLFPLTELDRQLIKPQKTTRRVGRRDHTILGPLFCAPSGTFQLRVTHAIIQPASIWAFCHCQSGLFIIDT